MRHNKKLYGELRKAVGNNIHQVTGTFNGAQFFLCTEGVWGAPEARSLEALRSRIEADMNKVCCAINHAIMVDMQRFLDDLWEDKGVDRELRRHRYNKDGERDEGRYPFSRLHAMVKDELREGYRECLAGMDWHSEQEEAWNQLLEKLGFGQPEMEWEYDDGLVQEASFTAQDFDFKQWLRVGRRMKLSLPPFIRA